MLNAILAGCFDINIWTHWNDDTHIVSCVPGHGYDLVCVSAPLPRAWQHPQRQTFSPVVEEMTLFDIIKREDRRKNSLRVLWISIIEVKDKIIERLNYIKYQQTQTQMDPCKVCLVLFSSSPRLKNASVTGTTDGRRDDKFTWQWAVKGVLILLA